jgi:hypothetical protein
MMRLVFVMALPIVVACLLPVTAAAQDGDDGYAWITKCMADNKAKGADEDVAHDYCACIDHEMGDEEINDVAGWEKANAAKAAECRAAVDWK